MSITAPLRPLTPPPVSAPAARQLPALLAVVLGVGITDQLAKAWAWRHLTLVHINSGSGLLFGDRAGAVYRDDVLGAALDGGALALLVLAAALLLQRRRPPLPFLGLALVLAGWGSNLADRLGLHTATAPGSRRGVVDFIHWDGRLWNVADLAIVAGAAICLVSALVGGLARALVGSIRSVAARRGPGPARR